MTRNPVAVEPWTAAGRDAERLCSWFVCRVSGVASDGLGELRASCAMQRLEEVWAAEGILASRRERVSNLLFAAIGAEADRDRRNSLLAARRDLFNGRALPPDRLHAICLSLPAQAAEAVQALQAAILEQHRIVSEWAQVFLAETTSIRTRFREFVRDPAFRKGLLVSSRSLYSSLERYATAGGAPTGREEKMERGFLRYYTRAAMKATPFSTFCTVLPGKFVAVNGEERGGADAPLRITGDLCAKRSYVRINKALCGILLDHLKGRPTVRRWLVVEPNPTLKIEGRNFLFLTEVQQREVFQRVPANEVLILVDTLLRRRPSSTLGDLIEDLARDPDVEATSEEAEEYLDRLLEIGYLRFRTGIREQDADWDLPLRELLTPIDDDHARECNALLRGLRERLGVYASATVADRAGIVEEIHAVVEAAFASMEVKGPIPREMPFYEDVTAEAAAVLPLTSGWLQAVDTLVEWMRLTVHLAWPRPEQATMRHFFDTHYGIGAAPVPLLRFYEDFYREHFKAHAERERKLQAGVEREALKDYRVGNPFELEFVETLYAACNRLQEHFLERWREAPDAEEICVSLAEVEEALREVKPQTAVCWSMDAFVIPVPPCDGADAALLLHEGSYTVGYGKYFSRFLYMLPEYFREAVRTKNEALTGELLAEIGGDAHFNANLHPPLLPWEISYPTGESGIAEEQLPSSTILVEPDAYNAHGLALRHAPSGRRVFPVDLGFLNPRMRPPLYQLLSRFTPPVVFAPSFSESLNLPCPASSEGGEPRGRRPDAVPLPESHIEHRPRITVEGRLILTRRRWTVPGALFPQREAKESAGDFFIRANRWRREAGIPESSYLRIIPISDVPIRDSADRRPGGAPPHAEAQEAAMNLRAPPPGAADEEEINERTAEPSANAAEEIRAAAGLKAAPAGKQPVVPISSDLYKPQFMDFANPLLVGLLGKMAANLRNYQVVVEERLPGPGKVVRHDGASYATELIVQIDFPEGTTWSVADALQGVG